MQRSCREPCVFLPFLIIIIGAHAAKLQGTLCVSTFSYYYYYYYWGPCSEAAALCVSTWAHAAKLQGTLCVSSYIYYYSSFFCHGMSMAAHRTVCQKVVKFGTQVKDSCMFNFTQLHVANKHALAPPTGQSFRYICAHNF